VRVKGKRTPEELEEDRRRKLEAEGKLNRLGGEPQASDPQPTNKAFIRAREKALGEFTARGIAPSRTLGGEAVRAAEAKGFSPTGEVRTPEEVNLAAQAKTEELTGIAGFGEEAPTEVDLLDPNITEEEKRKFIEGEIAQTASDVTGIPTEAIGGINKVADFINPFGIFTDLFKAGFSGFKPKEHQGLTPQQIQEVERSEIIDNTNGIITDTFDTARTSIADAVSSLLGKAEVFGVSISDISGGSTERLDFEKRFDETTQNIEAFIPMITDLDQAVTKGMPHSEATALLNSYNDSINELETTAKLLANISDAVAVSERIRKTQAKILEARTRMQTSANAIARISIGGVETPATDIELAMFNAKVRKNRDRLKGGS